MSQMVVDVHPSDLVQSNSVGQENFCSQISFRSEEQIYATASHTTVWLVLEYTQAWGAKALVESSLPDPVKTYLLELGTLIPGSRFQFIKQQSANQPKRPQADSGRINFYVARSGEENSTMYRFQLEQYEELLDLDIPAIASGDSAYREHLYTDPLFLVCTNGKRDRCCAKFGLPIYQAMRSYCGDSVWQTTHTGGHRFAATMVCLPEGIFYGWVKTEEIPSLVDAYQEQQIYQLDRYRGRSCYDSAAQAAEYYLRQKNNAHALSHYHFLSSEAIDDNRWSIQFSSPTDSTIHTLDISRKLSEFEHAQSCGKEAKRVPQYYLEAYEVERHAAIA